MNSVDSRRLGLARLAGRAAGMLVGFATLLGMVGTAAAQFSPSQAAIARFDADTAAGVAEDAGGFASVAVFIKDEVVWSKGYGWADIENGIAANEYTIGRTGSISKSFTAVVMMQLAERGVLSIDDPVERYLPELEQLADGQADQPAVTFRMLASHTAGLIREPRLRGAASGSIYRWEQKLLESIPATSFQSPPLTRYSYSNIGYGILGLACSRAAGVPFIQLVEDQIFIPLEMTSSTFVVNTADHLERLAVGYSRRSGSGEVDATAATREHLGRGYKVPNGGIYSTVGDLAKFAAALMGETRFPILSGEGRNELFTLQPPAQGYGLGFSVQQRDGMKLVGHGGSVAGYNADLAFDLNTGIGVATLRTTSYNPPSRRLLRQLVALEIEAVAGSVDERQSGEANPARQIERRR